MNRIQRQAIAEHTVRCLQQQSYPLPNGSQVDLRQALHHCLTGTRYYAPDTEFAPLQPIADAPCTITLSNETSLQAAQRMAAQGPVLLLNFASAKHPGGGFLRGTEAQEESLARASGLYSSLQQCPQYYQLNRAQATELYTDAMIYSPQVPVFRLDNADFLPQPYQVSMLTVPAVKAVSIRAHHPERIADIGPTMQQRMDKLLHCCADLGYQRLILGAWGCGVFQNDPVLVAQQFQTLLNGKYQRSFSQVHFAVLDHSSTQTIYNTFNQYLQA